jgi:hypothetical protein
MLIKNERYNLLGITLRKSTCDDAKHYDTDFKGVGLSTSDVHSFACVQIEGSKNTSNSEAIKKIRQFFELIRAFCFPFGRNSESWNTGIFGDIPLCSSIPIIRNQSQYCFISNQRNMQIELEDKILPKLTNKQWELLNATKKWSKRLYDSIHWLAEATKPDTNNAKYIKISIALETLLGKEPSVGNLRVKSITVMLAERAAFLTGTTLFERISVDKKIRNFYDKRSKIIHGDGKELPLKNIDEFGELVRKITLTIIESNTSMEYIANPTKLESWIKEQKYTLPENNEEVAPHASSKS